MYSICFGNKIKLRFKKEKGEFFLLNKEKTEGRLTTRDAEFSPAPD